MDIDQRSVVVATHDVLQRPLFCIKKGMTTVTPYID